MFCRKCGKQIPDNAPSCTNCGTPVAMPRNAQPQVRNTVQQPPKEYTQAFPNRNVQAHNTPVPPARPVPPVAPMPPAPPAPPAAPDSAKKQKKQKKKGNLALKIIAIILVLAVLVCGGYLGVFGIQNDKEIKGEGVQYINDFPVLKRKTDFTVYDAEKFPAEKYEIKVEKFMFGGLLSKFSSKTEVFTDTSTKPIYQLNLDDGNYRITLKDITSSRTQTTTAPTTAATNAPSTNAPSTNAPSTNAPTTNTDEKAEVVIIIIIDVVVKDDDPEAVDKVDLNWSADKAKTQTLSGKISQAENEGAFVQGASVKIYQDDKLVSTVKSDAEGNYTVDLPAGNYHAVVAHASYKTTEFDFVIDLSTESTKDISLEAVPTGILSGKICKASDRTTAISGATIDVFVDSESILTETSDSSGNYSVSLPEGVYTVKITCDGYIEFNSYATVVVDETTYMETFLLIDGSTDETGTASGTVFHSLTKDGVAGVTLTVKNDWNNADGTGETVKATTTDSNGNYTLDLPLGNYTVIATKDGFTTSNFNIIVQKTATDNQNGTITPIISGDDYLITLSWGSTPYDLDAHLFSEDSSGYGYHVYYYEMVAYDGNKLVCELDYDDTESYGPEHITLKADDDETYYFFVHRFSDAGSLAASGAKVTIEQGNVLIAEYNVPTDAGDGEIWNVFAIKDGTIITGNTLKNEVDDTYAD